MMATRKQAGARANRPQRSSPATTDFVTWAYGVLAGSISQALLSRLPRLPDGDAPRTVALGAELSLIVARVPREPFEAGTLEARLRDIEWVGRYASAHHTVIERLGQRGTILPLRMFTVFDSDDSAKKTLGRNRRRLAALASRVGTKSEWVLRVHRPTPPPPPAPKASAESGTAFLRARADAHRERVARARMIDTGVATLIGNLTMLAEETVERAVEPGTTALAEAAFLVGKRQIAGFKRALTTASADLRREGCRIALTGPWPVYSFVELTEDGHD
jgi:hypothetical protein